MEVVKRNLITNVLFALVFCILVNALPHAQAQESSNEEAGVMESFTQIEKQKKQDELENKEKHQILFYMGFALLLLLIATAGLGIALGVYGKRVFVPHMLFAGLSVTLAIVHSIVAMVWFFPF